MKINYNKIYNEIVITLPEVKIAWFMTQLGSLNIWFYIKNI